MIELPTILEALLQASEEPLSSEELLEALKKAAALYEDEEEQVLPLPESLTLSSIESALQELENQLLEQGRSIGLRRRPKGWKLMTRAEFAPYVRGIFPDSRPSKLSTPALETLAIIAYRQPVTKAEIEVVRGVSVDAMVQKLLDLGLVRITGRADKPGRPLLFSTTVLFLEHFGIEEQSQLPNHEELSRIALPQPEIAPTKEDERQMSLGDQLDFNQDSGEAAQSSSRQSHPEQDPTSTLSASQPEIEPAAELPENPLASRLKIDEETED